MNSEKDKKEDPPSSHYPFIPENRHPGTGNGIMMQDKELFIRHAFTGDPSTGCELLFKSYYGVLCSYAVRFVYSKEVAEDIVGEVFYRFWEKEVFTYITTSYRAYLFSAVRNSALNYVKKEFVLRPVHYTAATDASNTPPDPFNILQAEELKKIIERTVHALSRKCQLVFLMNRVEGKKYTEIAAELNISVKAVEAHISKALDILRKVLQKEYAEMVILCILTGIVSLL